MSRGGYKGKSNYPHKFEECPKCGKKGFYRRVPSDYEREYGADWEYRCKYCGYLKRTYIGEQYE